MQCILTAGKSRQLAAVMRQTHITRALTLALCSHLVWAGPQLEQIKKGKWHSFTTYQFHSYDSLKSILIYSLLVADIISQTCNVYCTSKGCSKRCPLIYNHVCGTDGRTHNSRCQMQVTACLTGKEIQVGDEDIIPDLY